jgi:hypothetical protein
VLAAGAAAAYVAVIRPWQLRWGATPSEIDGSYPGDELIVHPTLTHTRALTVDAPPAAVWPWLVQIGQGRAGLYSYDWLENLVGCDIHSRDRIVPELQRLDVGDVVSMRRGDVPSFTVAAVDPERALVLRARDPDTGGIVDMAARVPLAADSTWTLALRPVDGGATRLIERMRLVLRPRVGDRLMWEAVELASFVMGRRMLLGIKERAERVHDSA